MNTVLGKSIQSWIKEYPLLKNIIHLKEVFWLNPTYNSSDEAINEINLSEKDIKDVELRLNRFAPYIKRAFPETESQNGIIESPLKKISQMEKWMSDYYKQKIYGNLYIKCDSHLSISGSIKARGGIYEVLKYAENLAIENNMLSIDENYAKIDSKIFKSFYSNYTISVSSTGNLGLSIGIISAKLGFKVFVHMSSNAKQWKKDLLRSKGVKIIEYNSDYSKAVEEGRKHSTSCPNSYFIDDENSKDLFLGYAVAAYRLKKQLDSSNIKVDSNHPLFVYLPCGVGGAPGGITFGLKLIFKNNVHCFFIEPTHSPCMLLGMMTGAHNLVSVQDFGIDNITDADGLAVDRASSFVGKKLKNIISGILTVNDNNLYILLKTLLDKENIFMEPSALASLSGVLPLLHTRAGKKYLTKMDLYNKINNSTHLAWGTGGNMVPDYQRKIYYDIGRKLIQGIERK